MPARNLTARFCEAAKPVDGKQVSYPDTQAPGLELRVSPGGRKTWTFRYRTRDDQRQARITLGVFSDEFDLERARREARKARVTVDDGGDPAETRRQEKHRARTQPIRTFDDLAQAYFRACERGEYRPRKRKKRQSSLDHERAVYDRYLKDSVGRWRLEKVTKATFRNFIRGLIDAGATTRANRAHAIARQMLNFAVDHEERLPANPIAKLAMLVPEAARKRVYNDQELARLWQGITSPEGLRLPAERRRNRGDKVYVGPAMKIALKLTLMLMVRRSEVAGMALAELNDDRSVWLIPGERTKSGRPHAVPISPTARAMIKEALELHEGRKTRFVFPHPRADRSMSPNAMNHALKGVLYAQGIDDATLHDFRRTASTLMTSERLRISPFIRSLLLEHADTGGGARVSSSVYDANDYLPEKRAALLQWEGLLLEIVGVRERPSNVHALSRA
ncbi:tyrosine-type recombinase/integrase [Caulobacter sp. KR2-114]|uniref:tyrosine-type recombinase/integrase n=1 Tax=Caulobacter sp. KR2-114 TaxID=3400912 RepID=UPI003C0510FA